jgi:hypothetical protein
MCERRGAAGSPGRIGVVIWLLRCERSKTRPLPLPAEAVRLQRSCQGFELCNLLKRIDIVFLYLA